MLDPVNDLVRAAGSGNQELVENLLAGGVDVNTQTDYGVTSLIEASRHGHAKLVKTLIERGADVNLTDKKGRNALLAVAPLGHPDVAGSSSTRESALKQKA